MLGTNPMLRRDRPLWQREQICYLCFGAHGRSEPAFPDSDQQPRPATMFRYFCRMFLPNENFSPTVTRTLLRPPSNMFEKKL
jgi:hypothetical protein